LGGFLTGLFLAWTIRTKVPSGRTYPWEAEDYKEEEDEFLQHFDEEGNFIESEEKEAHEEQERFRIRYIYRKGEGKKEDPS